MVKLVLSYFTLEFKKFVKQDNFLIGNLWNGALQLDNNDFLLALFYYSNYNFQN